MKIQGLEKLLKDNLNQPKKLYEGSVIKAKIIALDDNRGAIKLFDGSVFPAIFLSRDIKKDEGFLKFFIESIENETVTLKLVESKQQEKEFNEVKLIADKLSIPQNKVQELITSLIKFNLPATDENIILLNNTVNIIQKLKGLSDEEFKTLLDKFFNIKLDSSQLEFIKQYLNNLEDVDTDFLCFMLENKLSISIDNIIKTKQFLTESTFVNYIIQNLANHTNTKPTKIYTLAQVCEELSLNLSSEIESNNIINDFIDKFDIIKMINKNYSFYFFNTPINNSLYQNSIIIKNKYKSKKVIDINDVKFFMKVVTPHMETVEAYIHKQNNNILINLKCAKEFINLLKDQSEMLKSSLHDMGLNLMNISVDEISNSHKNLVDFFNEAIFSDLDVKV